jgi:hypothetical protein
MWHSTSTPRSPHGTWSPHRHKLIAHYAPLQHEQRGRLPYQVDHLNDVLPNPRLYKAVEHGGAQQQERDMVPRA